MMSISIQKYNNAFTKGLLTLIALIAVVISKDLAHAFIRDYSFYLSESLLFGTFWLLFVPSILIIRKKVKRNLFLPLVMSIIHLVVFSLLVYIISTVFFKYPFGFYKTFINTASQYGIVCIMVYGVYTFLSFNKQPVLKTPKEQLVSEKIKIAYQNNIVLLDCKDILYIKSEKPYIALVTKEKTYLHTSTLKKFLEEKATINFIQIHKSTIVNTSYIIGYSSRKNGDYDILLKNQQSVRASRHFNQNFKPFFDSIGLA
ncbi:LytTR family DNA-binding domain-containing protein [Dokdonia sp.]|uniref:LytTR family DNA-binding domain-containing protein n=1 Tax=Dokdonia sp. TaxID=2024995 RepID=UPI0032665DD7